MKLRYGICLFSLFVLMVCVNYAGYRKLEDQVQRAQEESIPQAVPAGKAAALPQAVLNKQGQYRMEFYDQDTGRTETVSMELPQELIGKSEPEVLLYLEEQKASFREMETGFLDLELLDFSPDRLTVRKTYSSLQKEYQFYLTVEEGMVVVYKSDGTLYQYTNMQVSEFSVDMQAALQNLYYIKDLTELYDLLENATS